MALLKQKGCIEKAPTYMYDQGQVDPRQLKIKEAILLMRRETWFKKSFAGAAES